jgi:hypothetical protein
MIMNRAIVVSVVILLCISELSANPQSVITGQVTDSEGAAISNARVFVHWDSSGSTVGLTDNIGITQDVIVVTDANGSYSASVPSGFYDVFVSAMGFTPSAAKVRVKLRTTHDIERNAQSRPSSHKGTGSRSLWCANEAIIGERS